MKLFAFFIIIQTINAESFLDKCLLKGRKTGICTELRNCPSALEAINENKFPCTCDFIDEPNKVCCAEVVSQLKTEEAPEKCKLQNDEEGICIDIRKCPGALDDIKKYKIPRTCRFEGRIPIVCCKAAKQSKSKEMCKEWNKIIGMKENTYSCNFLELPPPHEPQSSRGFTVGGFNAEPAEFPHMAVLGYGDEKTRSWSCGGSLISENFILTAAHCLYSRDIGNPNTVRLGILDLDFEFLAMNDTSKDYKIKRAIRHPNYKPPSKYNDIALLELTEEVKFNRQIKPACLQVDHQISDEILTATGWGSLGFQGAQPKTLQKIFIRNFSLDDCNKFYPNSTRSLRSGVASNQICAGEDGIDTCEGDSGGPLQVKNKFGLYNIIGVTSFGKACGLTKAPGVYTRVSKYVDWIESIVWP